MYCTQYSDNSTTNLCVGRPQLHSTQLVPANTENVPLADVAKSLSVIMESRRPGKFTGGSGWTCGWSQLEPSS